MVTYGVCLDGAHGGPWMGHVLELMGCMWLAQEEAAVAARASRAVSSFLEWLQRHGEANVVPLCPEDIQIEVVDVQQVPGFGKSGAAVGFFDWDLQPAEDADISTAIRRLGYARRDLLELVVGLPPAVLDWQPPNGKRTVRENLLHVRDAQAFYLHRILGEGVWEVLPKPWPADTFASLEWVRDRAVATLLELDPCLRGGVFHAEAPREDWTVRKMLRRFVEHELEHVQVIRRTLNLPSRPGGKGQPGHQPRSTGGQCGSQDD